MAEFACIAYSMQIRDDEFLKLTPPHRHVWLALLAIQWPQSGIFKGGMVALENATGLPTQEIETAIDKFISLAWMERDGEFMWITGWIKHRSHNANWRKGALDEAASLLDATPLAQRCLDRYTASDGVRPCSTASASVRPILKQSKDSKAKKETTAATRPLSRSAKKKPELPAPTPAALRLAQQMETDISRLVADGHPCAPEWRRTPLQIARSLDLSKVPVKDLAGAWAWGLEQPFWQPQLLQQASFDKQPNRWIQLVNGYLAPKRNRGNRPGSELLDHAELAR